MTNSSSTPIGNSNVKQSGGSMFPSLDNPYIKYGLYVLVAITIMAIIYYVYSRYYSSDKEKSSSAKSRSRSKSKLENFEESASERLEKIKENFENEENSQIMIEDN
jgi:hypothetical protein